MAEFQFFGKFDSSTASNSSINVRPPNGSAPEITFLPAPGGDVFLDDFGLTDTVSDPNTLVRYLGTEYSFRVEFSGVVDNTNKANNNGIANEDFTIITIDPGGLNVRIIFFPQAGLTQAQVSSINNGAYATDSESTNTVIVCFASDVMVESARGVVPVGAIMAGDCIRTLPRGQLKQVLWCGQFEVDSQELIRDPHSRPIRIFGHGAGDLRVSRQHRVALSHPQLELLFGHASMFIPAHWLVDAALAEVDTARQPVTYVHLMFERHEVLMAHGFAVESLLVGDMVKCSADQRMQHQLQAAYSNFREADFARDITLALPQMNRCEFNMLYQRRLDLLSAALIRSQVAAVA